MECQSCYLLCSKVIIQRHWDNKEYYKYDNSKNTGTHIFEACEKSENDYTESIIFTSKNHMTTKPLDRYITSITWTGSSTPAMMDESSIFLLISSITKQHIVSYEELKEANIVNIFIYDIPEDKKEFNIETVRQCILDIDLMPYEWKNIYILRHFSTATRHAQNALLKILEECPLYAVIILEVENPHAVLETIRSRVIDLSSTQNQLDTNSLWEEIVEYYKKKEYTKLAGALYDLKCTSNEAISILQWVYPYLSKEEMAKCDDTIESLAATHENPRSILDLFFL